MQTLEISKNYYNPYYQAGLKIKDFKNSLTNLSNLYDVDLLKDFHVVYDNYSHSFKCDFDKKLFTKILSAQYETDHSTCLFNTGSREDVFSPIHYTISDKAENILLSFENLYKFNYKIPGTNKNIDMFYQFISKFADALNESLTKAKPFLNSLNISYDIILNPIPNSIGIKLYFANLPLNMVYGKEVITVEQNDVIINVIYKNILSMPTTKEFYTDLNDKSIKNNIVSKLKYNSRIHFDYQDPPTIKTHIFNPFISTGGSCCFGDFDPIIHNYANELNLLGTATTLFKWLTHMSVHDTTPNRNLYNIIPGKPKHIAKYLETDKPSYSSHCNCEIFIKPDYEACKRCTLNDKCHTYSSFKAFDPEQKERSYNAFMTLHLWNLNKSDTKINLETFKEDLDRLKNKDIVYNNLLNGHAGDKYANLGRYFVPNSVAMAEAFIMEKDLKDEGSNFDLNKSKWFTWKRKKFYHGEIVKFTWIDKRTTIGKLHLRTNGLNRSNAFACQDLLHGDSCANLFGYKHGWRFHLEGKKLSSDMKTITKVK